MLNFFFSKLHIITDWYLMFVCIVANIFLRYVWFSNKWPRRWSRYIKWQGSVESVVSFYFVYIRLINASLMVRSTSFRRGSVPSDPHGSTSFVKVPQCTPSNEHIKYHSKLIREVAVTTTPLHLWSLLSGLLLRV